MIDLTGAGGEAGGVLVRRVSHAVMNDLAVVRLLLDSAGAELPSGSESAAGLVKAADLVGNVADLLGQLSALARPATGCVDADLREVVRRVDRLLDVAAGPGATVRTALPDAPVVAVVDPRRAQHALLADIAVLGQASEPGSTITVGIDGGDAPAITIATEDVAVTG
ncbi:MAG: hypothetical protein JWO68_91 [Actinomycetia bacterium]|nr:hypothetical protein [Actinomycetes bacterium]